MSTPSQALQRRAFSQRFIQWLTYAYLIRFPLLTAAALAGLPYLAFRTGARSLLENLFDLSPFGVALVTMTALLAAWSVMVTARLALIYSNERFGVSPAKIGLSLRWRHILYFGLLAAPIVAGVVIEIRKLWDFSTPAENRWKLLAIAPGALTAFLLLWVADLLQRRLNSPATNRKAPDLLMPSDRPLMGAMLEQISESRPMTTGPGWLAKKMKNTPGFFGRGYVDYDADPADRFPLLPGHGVAIAMMTIFLTVYVVVGLATSPWLSALRTPSLAAVLLLLTMLNWGLSGAAFFFDRYRIPVLVSLAILLGLASMIFSRSDSYYIIYPKTASAEAPTSQPLLGPRENAKVILVAANGGGIQASAWTARVLTGIERECRASAGASSGCGASSFARSVRLVSAVSGGSVGAMYFAHAYQNGALPPEPERLEQVVQLAGRSSLDGVAWGLVYPDFLRTMAPFLSEFPFFWQTDRGRALEHEWQRGVEGLAAQRLDQWRRDALAGQRPGVVFNATLVDNGRPLLFSTIDHDQDLSVAETFEKLYKNRYDAPVTSAVRLSATFPYVTPAARAHRDDQSDFTQMDFHAVDGGYYDNYGMATLVEWLDRELEKSGLAAAELMVIRIHSMPVSLDSRPDSGRGFLFQTEAPLLTLNNVRGAGQLSHGNVEFDLLQKRWAERADRKVTIKLAKFEYPNTDAPLSWHLTEKQKREIESAWRDKFVNDPNSALGEVKKFLAQ